MSEGRNLETEERIRPEEIRLSSSCVGLTSVLLESLHASQMSALVTCALAQWEKEWRSKTDQGLRGKQHLADVLRTMVTIIRWGKAC